MLRRDIGDLNEVLGDDFDERSPERGSDGNDRKTA